MDHMQGHERLFRATKVYRKLKYSVIGESCQRNNMSISQTLSENRRFDASQLTL